MAEISMLLGIILRIAAIILAIIGFSNLILAKNHNEKNDSQAAYFKQAKSTICFILETLMLWIILILKM